MNIPMNIGVDGGINTYNAKDCLNAGANVLISGSTIFKSTNITKTIDQLRSN